MNNKLKETWLKQRCLKSNKPNVYYYLRTHCQDTNQLHLESNLKHCLQRLNLVYKRLIYELQRKDAHFCSNIFVGNSFFLFISLLNKLMV